MMHGVIRPTGLSDHEQGESLVGKLRRRLHPYRWFMLFVMLPTVIVAAYYYIFASDQYESGADFVIRKAESGSRNMGGLGQILGFSLGASSIQNDAAIVQEYLQSHDAVAKLRAEDQLVERFTRTDIDPLSKLRFDTPRPETLLKYYRKQVTVTQDPETGITHLRVRAFSPADAHVITSKLLALGEARINQLNERTYRNQISDARRELKLAEENLTDKQQQLTAFRRDERDIDPAGSGKAQLGLVTEVTGNLVAARSRLESMGRFLSKSSPQYRALASQVASLEAQVAGQSSRLAGQGTSIASNLGDYEDLMIRKEFATQRYAAAATAFETSRAEALKQQLYLTRIVSPNMPVKALYPERPRIIATVFFALLMAYAIGWLLAAGVKEHSM